MVGQLDFGSNLTIVSICLPMSLLNYLILSDA